MSRARFPLLILSAALLPPLTGCWSAYYDAHTFFAAGNFTSKDELALLQVPDMPAQGSPADKADMAAVLDWQARRTPAQCEEANAQARAGFTVFFGDISPLPGSPATDELLKKVKDDAWLAMGMLKSRYNRPRPYSRDKAVRPCLRRLGGLAYPSGHAALARVYALLLADIAPARRDEFIRRADEAALLRVIGGVHHPSDIEAGKRLADSLYAEFRSSPEFREALAGIRPPPPGATGQ